METAVTAIITPGLPRRQGGGQAVSPLPPYLDSPLPLIHTCLTCGLDVVLAGSQATVDEASGWQLDRKVQFATLPDSQSSPSAALRAGVQLSAQAKGWLLLPATLVAVKPMILSQLCQALSQHLLIHPSHAGRAGMPIGYGQELFSELIRLTSDRELTRLMHRYPAQPYEISDANLLMHGWSSLFADAAPAMAAPPTIREAIRG